VHVPGAEAIASPIKPAEVETVPVAAPRKELASTEGGLASPKGGYKIEVIGDAVCEACE
jgi:hypothetical protein